MNNEIMAKSNDGKKKSPLKAIKSYCKTQCCAGERESWINCSNSNCLLFRYRLGKGNRISKKTGVIPHGFLKKRASGARLALKNG